MVWMARQPLPCRQIEMQPLMVPVMSQRSPTLNGCGAFCGMYSPPVSGAKNTQLTPCTIVPQPLNGVCARASEASPRIEATRRKGRMSLLLVPPLPVDREPVRDVGRRGRAEGGRSVAIEGRVVTVRAAADRDAAALRE